MVAHQKSQHRRRGYPHRQRGGSQTMSRLQAAALAIALFAMGSQAMAQAVGKSVSADVQRGAYLVQAGGCLGCHTATKKDAIPFAGGARSRHLLVLFTVPTSRLTKRLE